MEIPTGTVPAEDETMAKMAQDMVDTAAAFGEQLEYRNVTTGDGNCFYHALLDQIRSRPEVSRLLRPEVAGSDHLADHLKLRQAIVGHVRDAVVSGRIPREAVGSDEFLEAQARPREFAENSVVTLAAEFLGIDIWLISRQNNPAAPYTKIESGRPAEARVILGYIPNLHFQSLHPVPRGAVGLTDMPPTKKRRLSDAERKKLARETQSECERKKRLASDASRK